MTLLQIITAVLTRAAGRAVDLKALLIAVKTNLPDLAPEADAMLAALELPADLAGVGTAVVPELGNIALFKFDGREHPSGGF